MRNNQLEDEIQIYDAVKGISRSEIEERVYRNAKMTNLDLTDDHLDVIETLIEHYKQECQTNDCHTASPHMRYLIKTYKDKGGSKYLYSLFNNEVDKENTEHSILTLIHELLDLPELTYNEDDGFGTIV